MTDYERGKEAGRLLMDVIYHLPGALGLRAAEAHALYLDLEPDDPESNYHRGRSVAYREIAELLRKAVEGDSVRGES